MGRWKGVGKDESLEKLVDQLTVVVSIWLVNELGVKLNEDFNPIVPYLIEREIYELWLRAKRGVGQGLGIKDTHLLARRREFLLATQDGLAEKLFRFYMAANPTVEHEYRDAMRYAQKRLQ